MRDALAGSQVTTSTGGYGWNSAVRYGSLECLGHADSGHSGGRDFGPPELRRVSAAGPVAIYQPAWRAGVGKPVGKEPAGGGVVAVYGDLTAGPRAEVKRRALERVLD